MIVMMIISSVVYCFIHRMDGQSCTVLLGVVINLLLIV